MRTPNGFMIDNPAWPLLQAYVSFWGVTSANGNALGTTIVDNALAAEPSYAGIAVKILSGPSAGQIRPIASHILTTLSVASSFTNAAGGPSQITAGTIYVIVSIDAGASAIISSLARPSVQLYEGWQDEAGIDVTVWTTTNPATGAAWIRGAVGELLMAYSAPNAAENCRIRSNQRWVVSPTLYGVSRVLRQFHLEFEVHVIGLANWDNANFILGLTPAIADTRATNNIIGWTLVGAGNALQALTDAGGAETVTTGFGENLLVTNKLRIDISFNRAAFFLNETLVANHVVNIPDAPMYLNFYGPTGGGGAATLRIGAVRAWPEDN